MRLVSIRLTFILAVLATGLALLLGGAGVAAAACSYSMTNVVEVAPGSTGTVGSLVITLDAATASSSAGSFVDFYLPAQPSGFGLTVTNWSMINATGSSSVNVISLDQRTVRLTVYSLSPASGGSVEIVLPLTISVPTGYNGDIGLAATAPSGSVFSSLNDLAPASLGVAVLRVDPDSVSFGNESSDSTTAGQILTASDIGASSLSITSVSITGANAGDFRVVQDNCSGQTLTAGQHASLGVVFAPSAAGERQAVLHFFSSDPSVPDYQVSLTGTGLAPAGAVGGTAVLKIGVNSYTVNGTVYATDVAPYIKDSRAFLPLRCIANAIGITDSNITWDPATQTVAINKGADVVRVSIGNTTMLINGEAIAMDTAPEITGGRTCLPVAWVARALNAQAVWDATNQTVTVSF